MYMAYVHVYVAFLHVYVGLFLRVCICELQPVHACLVCAYADLGYAHTLLGKNLILTILNSLFICFLSNCKFNTFIHYFCI